MSTVQEITLKNNTKLFIETVESENDIRLCFKLDSVENCQLHWGLCRSADSMWHLPSEKARPAGSQLYDRSAVRTPFENANGGSRVSITLERSMSFSNLAFALYYPDSGRWENNSGKNFNIALPVSETRDPMSEALGYLTAGRNVLFEQTYPLERDGRLSAAVCKDEGQYEVFLFSDVPQRLILHWGAAMRSRYEWSLPPEALYPAGSVLYDEKSVQTPFTFRDGINRLALRFSKSDAPLGIVFVLKMTDEGRWLKSGNKNIYVPVTQTGPEQQAELSGLAEEIIHGEMGDHSWTLMHRFNLCHDLIGTVHNNSEGLSTIYVWMRFSAIRQVDWQRNYNTKPSELSHAQDRLTLKIADMYIRGPQDRELLRLILSTLGRGGEGQRIRDEILHIMHRHHIKEVSGHFMEEWHQKLHNNTTPDDVVICEAYLAFLRSDGDLPLFYKTLEEGGVSRERMEGFERPITTSPDFIPHLKAPLIHDFENYLSLLKSIHSGTDLESAIGAARYMMPGEAGELLERIWQQRNTGSTGLADYVRIITRARQLLKDRLEAEGAAAGVRDLLYLDLALEEFLRVVIERSIHKELDGNHLVQLTGMMIENIRLMYDDEELSVSQRDWGYLEGLPRFSADWALHAHAVLERIGRATGSMVDRYYQLLQSRAEYLGTAFHAESWAVSLFSEEVVRGMPVFVLSMLIRSLEPILRRHAKLGSWQVVSPGRTSGWIELADTLGALQGKQYDRPSIIIADRVRGDEEPPEGATAIITPDTVDLVSHVAVRARNAHLLFATCYDADCLDRLKSFSGRMLALNVNVSGDVEFQESAEASASAEPRADFQYEQIRMPDFSGYALSSHDFSMRLVGGKSLNLKKLEHVLPEWIHLPVSAALPFGIFEKVLSMDINKETAAQYCRLIDRPGLPAEETLAELRRTVLQLHAPGELISSLRTIMTDSGLLWPDNWDEAWMCIKRVWASKWNDRACLSRKTWRIKHENILMAVLIQQVIDAEYAFVIHTANPLNGDRDELYAEAVPGLGETLVGNYPGRAMSFVSKKERNEPEILSYPSKSRGLFGGGLIFRSDSNAEDLKGYAGAGLYDSIMLEPPREVTIDYTEDRLTWDEEFRNEFMNNITKIGMLIEKQFGTPQDIEGAYARGRYYVVQTRPQVGLKEHNKSE